MPPQTARQRQQLAAQIAPILATTTAATAPSVISSLVAAGVSAAAAHAALTLIGATSLPQVLPSGTASRAAATSEQIYGAAYLVAAAERIQQRIQAGESVRQAIIAERSTLNAHRAAAANRRVTAGQVDAQARVHGPLLGWRARMDAHTSAECARANGKNFPVTQRPVIGWPGSVHPNCRCRPVAPFAGAGFVDGLITPAERREAVA